MQATASGIPLHWLAFSSFSKWLGLIQTSCGKLHVKGLHFRVSTTKNASLPTTASPIKIWIINNRGILLTRHYVGVMKRNPHSDVSKRSSRKGSSSSGMSIFCPITLKTIINTIHGGAKTRRKLVHKLIRQVNQSMRLRSTFFQWRRDVKGSFL